MFIFINKMILNLLGIWHRSGDESYPVIKDLLENALSSDLVIYVLFPHGLINLKSI